MRSFLRRHPFWVAVIAVAVVAGAASPLIVRQARIAHAEKTCRDIHAFAETLDEAPVTRGAETVAVIGDSYSQGWGLGGPAKSWPATFGEATDTTVFVDGFAGSGVTGSVYCPEASFLDRVDEVNRINPDAVIVQAGLNDVDATSEEIESSLSKVISRIEAERVVVVGPPAAPAYRRDNLARVDSALASAAEKRDAQYISLLDLELDYQSDRLHTNRAGQQLIGDAVAVEW
ncbi:SGNH/GDSL hydrolase family protein [Microbacterium aureliae]